MPSLEDNSSTDAAPPTNSCASTTTKRNAFSELMSPKKPKQTKSDSSSSTRLPRQIRTANPNNPHDPRNGLLPYILRSETYPPSIVIKHNPHVVLIRDAYPKATVHLLLLARDASKYNLHPYSAFSDPAFLSLMRSEAESAVKLAVSELSRLISPFSKSSQARLSAMENGISTSPADLPAGRDFSREIRVGIHAHPSMNHLHIHIISRDMFSECLRHKKHYNSFNTDFFIPLDDMPVPGRDTDGPPDSGTEDEQDGGEGMKKKDGERPERDRRTEVGYQNANLKKDLVCWRCGQNYGNKFTDFKSHLRKEYEEWREE